MLHLQFEVIYMVKFLICNNYFVLEIKYQKHLTFLWVILLIED